MVVEKVNGTELRFKNPGSLLLVVIGFAFWGVGFLDLLGHKSAEPDVLGLYSLPLFLLIILYGCSIVIWFVLFFNSKVLERVARGVKYIQGNTRLALTLMAGLGFSLWLIFEWDRWARLPGLQFTVFGFVVLAALILIFANWSESVAQQRWRKIFAYPLFALLAVEAVLQVFAWFGVLPVAHKLGGHFYPYERIYYPGKTIENDFANRYGWYYLDNKLDTKKKHILVVGGNYVQGLQVQPEQQLSAVLTSHMNEGETDLSGNVDLIPIGVPGFGLTPFLFEDAMSEMPQIVNADEMIVMFHLGDDFQSPVADETAIRYVLDENNDAAVDPEDARLRHDLTHYYLRGYMSFQIVGVVRSNYLTQLVISDLMRGSGGESRSSAAPGNGDFDFPRLLGHVSDYYTLTEPGHAGIKTTELKIISGGNNFMFTQGGSKDTQEAIAIADSLLRKAQAIAIEKGISLRVVTIPAFPDEFFSSAAGGTWEPQVSGYDLLLPERALVEIAGKYGISILPMGQYMLDDELTADEIQTLYLPNAEAGFTPQGHAYFADAIFACFYSNVANDVCSK